jgi:hypothetical protein
VLSIAVAVIGGVPPLAFGFDTNFWIPSVCLALLWVILLVVGLIKFKRRGLWLLVGAPIALYFPFAVMAMLWACAHNRFACPCQVATNALLLRLALIEAEERPERH